MPEFDALPALDRFDADPPIAGHRLLLGCLALNEDFRFSLVHRHGVFLRLRLGFLLGRGRRSLDDGDILLAWFGNLKRLGTVWTVDLLPGYRFIGGQVLATMRTVKVEVCHVAGTVAEQVDSDLLAKVMPAQTHDF